MASFTLIELATPKIEASQAQLPFLHHDQPMTHDTGKLGLAEDVGYHKKRLVSCMLAIVVNKKMKKVANTRTTKVPLQIQ